MSYGKHQSHRGVRAVAGAVNSAPRFVKNASSRSDEVLTILLQLVCRTQRPTAELVFSGVIAVGHRPSNPDDRNLYFDASGGLQHRLRPFEENPSHSSPYFISTRTPRAVRLGQLRDEQVDLLDEVGVDLPAGRALVPQMLEALSALSLTPTAALGQPSHGEASYGAECGAPQ